LHENVDPFVSKALESITRVVIPHNVKLDRVRHYTRFADPYIARRQLPYKYALPESIRAARDVGFSFEGKDGELGLSGSPLKVHTPSWSLVIRLSFSLLLLPTATLPPFLAAAEHVLSTAPVPAPPASARLTDTC
jgi:hypothetical protein